MDDIDVSSLVFDLGSLDDATRKKAAFRLSGVIGGDPSFADVFIAEGGLPKLRNLVLATSGNTLAYSLTSMSNLLGLDQGWGMVDAEVVERLVQLVVGQPLVNILRGAMSILAAVVSHESDEAQDGTTFGFRALKPIINVHTQFLEMLVSRLTSADHALCANALQLINAIMRDAITNDVDGEWSKLIKSLQDLGVIKAAYAHMQSSSLQDLALPLLEFQALTKLLLRKWKEIQVDLGRKDHRAGLKRIDLASKLGTETIRSDESLSSAGRKEKDPERWRRLGFESESPAWDFEAVGYLGMMDLTEFVRKSEDGFYKIMLEESNKPAGKRCPIARAALAVTLVLYDHFEIDRSDTDFQTISVAVVKIAHKRSASLFSLMDCYRAEIDDFGKIEELVRILIAQVLGLASRTRGIEDIESDIAHFELLQLRNLQMRLLEMTHQDVWGKHLDKIKNDLREESMQFLKEQRIRCLLHGSWFPNTSPLRAASDGIFNSQASLPWRYIRLAPNRRYIHYGDFAARASRRAAPPSLEILSSKVELSTVTSVVSNTSPPPASDAISPASPVSTSSEDSAEDSDDTVRSPIPRRPSLQGSTTRSATSLAHQHRKPLRQSGKKIETNIIIHGHIPSQPVASAASSPTKAGGRSQLHRRNQSSLSNNATPRSPKLPTGRGGFADTTPPIGTVNADGIEVPLLTLKTKTLHQAAEWVDGLLMLMNQAPITEETQAMVEFVADYGLKIRLLNVRFDENEFEEEPDDNFHENGEGGTLGRGLTETVGGRKVVLPSRDGLDEAYFYEIPC